MTAGSVKILPALRDGGVLKFGARNQAFFLVKNSEQLPVDQSEAKRLATDGTLRPSGIDSHSNYVFALSATGASKEKKNG